MFESTEPNTSCSQHTGIAVSYIIQKICNKLEDRAWMIFHVCYDVLPVAEDLFEFGGKIDEASVRVHGML